MYILDQQEKTIHDSTYIQRYVIAPKNDGFLVCACMSCSEPTIKLGAYDTAEQANEAFFDLFVSLYGNATYFVMPPRERTGKINDARVKRRGGS